MFEIYSKSFWPNVINNADLYAHLSLKSLQEKMEMDRACSEDAEYNDCKSGSILEARWEKKSRKAKGNMTKGVGHGTIWRSRPGTGLSGGQWLRPYAPIGATRHN